MKLSKTATVLFATGTFSLLPFITNANPDKVADNLFLNDNTPKTHMPIPENRTNLPPPQPGSENDARKASENSKNITLFVYLEIPAKPSAERIKEDERALIAEMKRIDEIVENAGADIDNIILFVTKSIDNQGKPVADADTRISAKLFANKQPFKTPQGDMFTSKSLRANETKLAQFISACKEGHGFGIQQNTSSGSDGIGEEDGKTEGDNKVAEIPFTTPN